MAEINGTAGPDTLDGTEDGDVINGFAGDDTLRGNGGNDRLIAGTGFDILLGGNGDDELYFGADFTTADYAGGGEGTDRLMLQGAYAAVQIFGAGQLFNLERLELLAGNDTRFGDLAGNFYSYNFRTDDANVAAGQTLTVDMSALRSEEHVIFGGRSETDGKFAILGGFGDDTVAGGAGNDSFTFGAGRWGKDDSVDGWSGTDLLSIQLAAGNSALAFAPNQMVGIETLELRGTNSGGQHTITMSDGNVAAGRTLAVNAAGFAAGERLVFNGAAETDGNLSVTGGLGQDVLFAGRGQDTLNGGGGNDAIYFGASFGAGDHAVGGGGTDILYLQGNYAAPLIIEPGMTNGLFGLTLLSGSDDRFNTATGASYSYNLRLSDGNAIPTDTFRVDFSGLGSEEHVIFGARDEPDNNIWIFAGYGDDTIAGGGRDDTISFAVGRWGNDDSVDGWTGFDTLNLAVGAGANTFNFSGNQLFNIEKILLSNAGGAGTVNIKLSDGNVAAGQTLRLEASHSNGLASDDQLYFDGSAELDGNLNLLGGAGNDVLIAGHGQDTLDGGGGSNVLYFADRYGVGDTFSRGALYLQGDYAGLHLNISFGSVVLMSGTDTRYGDLAGNLYDYDIIGPSLGRLLQVTIDGRSLTAGESFTFHGTNDRADSTAIIYGGFGRDTFVGAAGGSDFRFDLSRWGSLDTVDGGASALGILTFQLGAGPDAVTLGTNQVFNIGTLKLLSGGTGSHTVNMSDGNVSFGNTMWIDAQLLKAAEQLLFVGNETDGSYRVSGGAGNDWISAGANADLLRGNDGNDTFVYSNLSRSTPAARDQIEDFTAGDLIDLAALDANQAAGGDQAFGFIGSAAFSNTAGELRASHATGATWFVQGDTDGNGAADFELLVTLADASLITSSDFVL